MVKITRLGDQRVDICEPQCADLDLVEPYPRRMGEAVGRSNRHPIAEAGGVYANFYLIRFDLGAYTEEAGESVGSRPDTRFYFRLKFGF